MASRLSLVFVGVFAVFLVFSLQGEASIVRRDAPEATEAPKKSASQTIDEAIDSFKTGLDDLLKKVQGNELFQNVTTGLKQFGESVQQQGKQLVEKIQSDVNKPKN